MNPLKRNVLFLAGMFLCILSTRLQAKSLEVPEMYPTIKSAIQSAKNEDVIRIKAGSYSEGEITVDKSISLEAVGKVIIDGHHRDQMLTITAPNVHIKGFTFINSGKANIRDIAAVKFVKVRNCSITESIFKGNFFSVYFSYSSHCLIRNNKIESYYKNESGAGNGIHLWKCDSMTIEGNEINGQRDGIYFEFVTNTFIHHNTSKKNLRYGLHFMFSDNNSFVGNHFENNGSGVAVMYSHDIVMKDNIFEKNWGGAAYGLLLKDINNCRITGNTFAKNTVGINMEESDKIYFSANLLRENGWAIKLQSSCSGDTLYKNNFLLNSFDVAANGTLNENYISDNYWDKYRGYDLNRDGKGDVPYRPASLSGVIMDRVPYSVMLMRSFILDILDQVEKVYPALIPENLADAHPSMKLLKN